VIFSSDGGQVNRPFPDDLIAQAAHELRELGLSDAELRAMMVDNPATLLSLPPRNS
jgi:predicted TIM-barrel fold metal-dependent hydrolase